MGQHPRAAVITSSGLRTEASGALARRQRENIRGNEAVFINVYILLSNVLYSFVSQESSMYKIGVCALRAWVSSICRSCMFACTCHDEPS